MRWFPILLAFVMAAQVRAEVLIDLVPVGNPGNTGQWSGLTHGPQRFVGSVPYNYQIGKYEVTAGQYTEFLNAVAKTDTYELYSMCMDYSVSPWGCNIVRTGQPGVYSYTVAPNWANRPVGNVSWGDAARFVNWLHNGQPTGVQGSSTTEDGSYCLNGATSFDALMAITRRPTATWVIPTEDEWYKAAYHKNDGATGNYWIYPTASNSNPDHKGSALLLPNSATFWQGEYTIGQPYWRTEAGAHENSLSPYGTFDQGGNILEWNESSYY